MADLKAFAEQLVNLSVKEVKELADILKEEYGIEPAAAAVAVAAGPAAAGAAVAEEKTAFLQNEDSLFVEMPINRIFKVESVKQDKTLRIKIDASLDEIKSIKI